jgi:hypothetical protein
MSDPSSEPIEDAPIVDEPILPPAYPDTTVGSLMRDRDSALRSAQTARDQVAQYQALAKAGDDRAAALQVAIDALGGEPTPLG